jgi:hypothetical protein
MSKKRDEKIKLLANAFNTGSTSSVTVGVIGPIVAVAINIGDAGTKVPLLTLVTNVVFWLALAIVLHFGARTVLDGLDD